MSWWQMGGYAWYVWSCYGLVGVSLALAWVIAYRRLKSYKRGKQTW